MPRTFVMLALIATLPVLTADSPKWIYLESDHFQLLTDGGEKSGRRTLTHFEQVRAFFRQSIGPNLTPLPVRIIQIESEARYKSILPSETAAAFYQSGADLDIIVMGPKAVGEMAVAVHEYFHVLIRHAGLSIPLWLNEGLAEVYSTVAPVGGKMQVGAPPPGRFALARRARMPLGLLFGMTTESSEYRSLNHAGDFYAQSWAIAHMAMLEDSMRSRFADFLKAVSEGGESEEAFRQIYGLTAIQLEDKVERYLGMLTINVAIFDIHVNSKAATPPARPAEPYEYELALAQIEASQGKLDAGTERCERMRQRYPSRPEPHEALAYLMLRGHESAKATSQLAEALTKGSTSRTAILHFLKLAPSGHVVLPLAETSAAKLIEANPDDLEARLALARCKLAGRQATQARAILKPVRSVPKRDAPEFFRLLAYAALGEGDTKEALSAAERLKSLLPPNRQMDANNLIGMVETANARAAAHVDRGDRQARVHTAFPTASTPGPGSPSLPALGGEFEPDEGPPKIRRVEQPAPTAAPEAAVRKWRTPDSLPSAEGVFESLDCSGSRAAMRVRTAERLLQLWIDDPLEIEMKNGAGASMEFTCGRQTASRRVIVQFDAMPPGRAGDGLVRSLLFP